MADDLYVCAIGASAGGLAPLEEFFDSVPEHSGIAFVVVQHLSPDHESMMATLLGRHTKMSVAQAVDGTVMEADQIYLIPPSTEMTVFGGRLRLRARPVSGASPPRPITLFFNSLASEFGERAIAIVLSGSGSDGAEGLESIRRGGGLTLAQDHTAAFEGMPDSARESGMVDATLAPSDMPEVVLRFARERRRPSEASRSLEAPELRILRSISEHADVDFTQYKTSTIHRRIARRTTLTRSDSLDDYAELVDRSSAERNLLVEDLLIDVSGFFRDAAAFAILAGQVEELMRHADEERLPLRIWSAATSTGEEAYSLAMLAVEARQRLDVAVPIQIFATDIHRGSLAHAAAGVYDDARMDGVSSERRERFFTKTELGWQIRKDVRSMVTFAHHNVLRDAPFTRLDLVVCRNMLIYLRPAAQETALSLLFTGVRMGGIFTLGPSEGPGFLDKDLAPVDRTWRIFRKEGDSSLRAARRLPAVAGAMTSSRLARSPRLNVTADQRLLRAYDAILDSQFVAGMLIDDTGELVHTFGLATRLMGPPKGRPTLDVVQLIEDPVLRIAVGAALNQLGNDNANTSMTRTVVLPEALRPSGADDPIGTDGVPGMLDARRLEIGASFYFLITMRPQVLPETGTDFEEAVDREVASQAEIDRLMSDLTYTRESLQSAVEQQETVNEELNATNEELLAANEELQSTNEELSSVNEELLTLNDEHQRQLEEVLQVSADLEQLLAVSDVAAVLLNQNGTIRRISEPAKTVFGVREIDIGRPFADLATQLERDQLLLDIRNVAGGAEPVRRRVTIGDPGAAGMLQVDRYELPHRGTGVFLVVLNAELGSGESHDRALLHDAPPETFTNETTDALLADNARLRRLVAELGGDPGQITETTHE